MFFLTLLAPIFAPYILGWPALATLVTLAADLGITLGLGVAAGNPGLPDYLSLSLTITLVGAWLGLTLATALWRNLESSFDRMPWLRHTQELQSRKGGRTYQTKCPFTGLRPTARCPSCSCRVHDIALQPPDRWVESLPVCDVPLRWDLAKEAMAGAENPIQARESLDRALDFRGNVLLAGVTTCCVGCAAWQKNCHLRPRLALGMTSVSVTFVILPWAFSGFSDTIGVAGTALQVATEALAVSYSTLALLVQIQAVLRANAFLVEYAAAVPELLPLFRPPTAGLLAHLHALFLHTPWEG
ncbi:hypothetical protein F751_4641 [Auxenochlorella protothecoides]|uniref:Uncharacterized protein n=1 Tax=Auxenochlorella protothecoides TaxID=3075 RepID=A0A087SK94_AUXPR|nr:hypothetical protein F751_4641 [Auxenochlorella protothecoides]KFM26148.1 hypothetical protein F751_4641 [Auxenochlorella protothecoides]